MAVRVFSTSPRGAFDLANQARFFGGWDDYEPDRGAVAMTFPVEGWTASATVVVHQPEPGTVTGEVHGVDDDGLAGTAWRQAMAVLSLDVDGSGFAAVADRDPVVGDLHRRHGPLRPTLFHSPYEAACNFVIGQRISMVQARAVRARLGREHGDRVESEGTERAAFPRPQVLRGLDEVNGLPAEKLRRLHGVAEAALAGVLDRDRLRGLPVAGALAELEAIHGIGPFSAQGILHRGAGLVDEVTDDPVSKQAAQRLYAIDHLPSQEEMLGLAERWRPYRMWATVLLHVWIRNEGGGASPPGRGRRRSPAAV